jgi:hypothetical protein
MLALTIPYHLPAISVELVTLPSYCLHYGAMLVGDLNSGVAGRCHMVHLNETL